MMNKKTPKKQIPPWVAVLVIAVVVVIVVGFFSLRYGRRSITLDSKGVSQLQKHINEGGATLMSPEQLKKMGITVPPDYADRVAKRRAAVGQSGQRRGGIPMRSGQ